MSDAFVYLTAQPIPTAWELGRRREFHWVSVPNAVAPRCISGVDCGVSKRFCGEEMRRHHEVLLAVVAVLQRISREIGCPASLSGRIKSFDSIRRKMLQRRISYLDIFDRIGVRIIVESEVDCYRLRERIHGRYAPIRRLQRDYVVYPKANGYQSLHTTVRNDDGLPIEIQLRTASMHESSEGGAAAHCLYKSIPENTSASDDSERRSIWQRSAPACGANET